MDLTLKDDMINLGMTLRAKIILDHRAVVYRGGEATLVLRNYYFD